MDTEKLKLIKSYSENYYRITGEHIKIVTCSEWEVIVGLDMKVEYWKLFKVISDLTGWEKKETFTRSRKEEVIFRRGLIDFIAINNGCTYTQCARETNRDHTTVMHSVRTFENKLNLETGAKAILKEVIKYLRENYNITKD